ncbi:hypothetical protein [Adoxophyes orana nucleopolyhedrovirus]|uniref:hypothetical protein n=1 Tax=Adoxophyes orana nucleopolyhedrovirus TaxID=542343 RepID=UPI0001829C44|nr:hypothetical protein [Adoxophyes orana nucleopolyhedrovirus]ACF05409.1 hypothetical protein [Adoxophyes orana nucleopolyhedrovirus]
MCENKDVNKQDCLPISITNLKKIETALKVLENINLKLKLKNEKQTELIDKLKEEKERQENKIQVLRQNLLDTMSAHRFMYVVRKNNIITFYTKGCLITDKVDLIVYKLSDKPNIDRLLCTELAKSKYSEKELQVKNESLHFCNEILAEEYAILLKRILSH